MARKMLHSAIKHLQACGIEPRIATRNKGGGDKDRVYSGVRIFDSIVRLAY